MTNEKQIDKICRMLDDLIAKSKRDTNSEPAKEQLKSPDFYEGYKIGFESAQPKWISVKERLPEFERRVLVMNGHGDVFILAFWRKTENKWSWVDDAGHFKHYNNITHWMPLPSTEGIE